MGFFRKIFSSSSTLVSGLALIALTSRWQLIEWDNILQLAADYYRLVVGQAFEQGVNVIALFVKDFDLTVPDTLQDAFVIYVLFGNATRLDERDIDAAKGKPNFFKEVFLYALFWPILLVRDLVTGDWLDIFRVLKYAVLHAIFFIGALIYQLVL